MAHARRATLSLSVLASVTFAQEGLWGPNPSTPTTDDPTKATLVSNGVQLATEAAVVPPASKAEQAKRKGVRALSPISADYEWESFSLQTSTQVSVLDSNGFMAVDSLGRAIYRDSSYTAADGSIHTLRAGYLWSSPDGKKELTAGYQAKLLLLDSYLFGPAKSYSAVNHVLSGGGRYVLREDDKLRWTAGGGLDFLLYSNEYTKGPGGMDSRTAWNFSLNTVAQGQVGKYTVVGGVLLQEAFVPHTRLTDLGLAFLWGVPVNQKLAINMDFFYRRTLLAFEQFPEMGGGYGDFKKFDYDARGVATPHSLSVGFTGAYAVSDRFGLNLGWRKQLLIEDYSSSAIVIGGRFAI